VGYPHLSAILKWVVPAMPTVWPVAIRVILIWLMTVGSATAVSVTLLHIPVLSRLVGREHSVRREALQQAGEEKPGQRPQHAEAIPSTRLVEQVIQRSTFAQERSDSSGPSQFSVFSGSHPPFFSNILHNQEHRRGC
jgi:hypothetical protein